jgi:hypothetical protein
MEQISNILRLADVLKKYDSLIRRLLLKVYDFATEAQKHCNLDKENVKKLKKLISKIGLLLMDGKAPVNVCEDKYVIDTGAKIPNKCVVLMREKFGEDMIENFDGNNYCSGHFITWCTIILLICVLYVYFIKKNATL